MMIANTRGFLWSDLETRALLGIWGEAGVQSALDGNFRNSHVYRDVARRLAQVGFERTPEQCRVRIKGLKRQYYQAKDGLPKGGPARKACKFFDDMDRILGARAAPGGPAHPRGGPTPGDAACRDQAAEKGLTGQGSSFAQRPVKVERAPFAIPVPPGDGECSPGPGRVCGRAHPRGWLPQEITVTQRVIQAPQRLSCLTLAVGL
ncbi:zinc finger and SCAN domain-containing protein 29-like [Elephas maximus indicus]|uniref:zinc finger and SCAN domain-containing protein 29-like n=1 Tax=Elephas maximus indicus TaxID=99487 RepID=UPI0021168433|nr:zinc finger and SCAN domain-containing protein 29-like [Elephas maximus indicus]